MKVTFQKRFEYPAKAVFNWHLKPAALERVLPPWRTIKVLSTEGSPDEEGYRVNMLVRDFFWNRFTLQRRLFLPPKEIAESQIEGPFDLFEHTSTIEPLADNFTNLKESFSVAPSSAKLEKELMRCSKWKHELMAQDLALFEKYPSQKMRILLSGASGLVGKALRALLLNAGHEVIRLVRSFANDGEDSIIWDPNTGDIDLEQFEKFDAVIHLAGESIASGRWSAKKKEQIFKSRCRDTWLLTQVLTRLKSPPKTFICASAIGIYGNRGSELLNEQSAPGKGFLADLCLQWEKATEGAANQGIRVIHTRFGVILSEAGGMLPKLAGPMRYNLGCIFGDGKQIISWISLDDVIGGIYHVLMRNEIQGAVNFTAPNPADQNELVSITAEYIKGKAPFRIPKGILKLVAGEMAEEMLLTSQKAAPEKLLESGYQFFYPDLRSALSHIY